MRTIRYSGRNHIVTFQTESVERLAEAGFETIDETVCFISGDGLNILGCGTSQRSPFDPFDKLFAYRLAFGRAVTAAYPLDTVAREALWDGFKEAVRNEQREAKAPLPPLPSPLVMTQSKQREILEAQQRRFLKIVQGCPVNNCDACENLISTLVVIGGQLLQLTSVGA